MADDEEHGLRPIGSPTSKIVDMLTTKVSTQTRSPKSSEISGTPKREVVPLNSTGKQHGASGAGTSVIARLRDLMARDDPQLTDLSLRASLEQLLGQRFVSTEREVKFDPIYGYDSELVSYRLERPVSDKDLAQARALAALTLEPMPGPAIVKELARLRMLTKSRPEAQADREASYVALAEELSEFPSDVIRFALRRIARRETFFPSLAEMIDQCQRLAHKRRLIGFAVGLEVD